MSNINGYCPSCSADLDGDLVVDYPKSQGRYPAECIDYARCYAGWNEHGELNRWGRAIAHSSYKQDKVTSYHCPDCLHSWPR